MNLCRWLTNEDVRELCSYWSDFKKKKGCHGVECHQPIFIPRSSKSSKCCVHVQFNFCFVLNFCRKHHMLGLQEWVKVYTRKIALYKHTFCVCAFYTMTAVLSIIKSSSLRTQQDKDLSQKTPTVATVRYCQVANSSWWNYSCMHRITFLVSDGSILKLKESLVLLHHSIPSCPQLHCFPNYSVTWKVGTKVYNFLHDWCSGADHQQKLHCHQIQPTYNEWAFDVAKPSVLMSMESSATQHKAQSFSRSPHCLVLHTSQIVELTNCICSIQFNVCLSFKERKEQSRKATAMTLHCWHTMIRDGGFLTWHWRAWCSMKRSAVLLTCGHQALLLACRCLCVNSGKFLLWYCVFTRTKKPALRFQLRRPLLITLMRPTQLRFFLRIAATVLTTPLFFFCNPCVLHTCFC